MVNTQMDAPMAAASKEMKFTRSSIITERMVFIDGLSGSGKSMLGPIVASFEGAERYRLQPIFEYICILAAFNKIDMDAAIAMLRLNADLTLYNTMISREINLRPYDNTGFLNNPHKMRSLMRLFQKDGVPILEEIKRTKPILQVNTNENFPQVKIALAAFGDALSIFEMVRHPAFLIKHWHVYVDLYGTDPRDTALWLEDGSGRGVPWFAYGWEKEYQSLNTMDKTIKSLRWLTRKIWSTYEELTPQQKKQVLILPFEKFVLDPWPYLRQMGVSLASHATSLTEKILKRQKIPRKVVTAGRIYKSYGGEDPGKKATNQSEFDKIVEFVNSQASGECKKIFQEMCSEYEQRFSLPAGLKGL